RESAHAAGSLYVGVNDFARVRGLCLGGRGCADAREEHADSHNANCGRHKVTDIYEESRLVVPGSPYPGQLWTVGLPGRNWKRARRFPGFAAAALLTRIL